MKWCTVVARVLVVLVVLAASAQSQALRGVILDANDNEPIAGARVEIAERLAAVSDATGSFRVVPVSSGRVSLRVRRVGYQPLVMDVDVPVGTDTQPVRIMLTRAPVSLAATIVTPGRFGTLQSESLTGSQSLSRREIENRPQLGDDVFRSINRLPGVAATDMSAGFAVRGGLPRELYTTLDGVELFEPFHLKDIEASLSIIDVQALGGADLTTSGFTAEYGSRLTGLFSMTTIDPRETVNRSSIGLSLTNLRASSQGSFANGRGAWLASARRGYLDAALQLTGSTDELDPRYYDVFGKLSYDLSPSHRITAHVLQSGDAMHYAAEGDPALDSRYGSDYAWLTSRLTLGSAVELSHLVSASRAMWRRDAVEVDERDGTTIMFADDSRTFDAIAARQDGSWSVSERFQFKWGVEVKRASFDTDYLGWHTVERGPSIPTRNDTTQAVVTASGIELGSYIAGRARFGAALTTEVGVRYDRHAYKRYDAVDPRLNVSYAVGSRGAVRVAWGRYSQPEQAFELPVLDGVTTFAPGERAEQRALGVDYTIARGLSARMELYDRDIAHPRPRFENLSNDIDILSELADDRTRIDPTSARARGIEFFLKQAPVGRFDWSVTYALANATDRIGDVDVPRAIDQRHALALDAGYGSADGWHFGSSFVMHSGRPITPYVAVVTPPRGGRLEPGPLRSERLPGYQRLDVRATRAFRLGNGQRIATYLDVFNALNRVNPRGYDYSLDLRQGTVVRRFPIEQIPILPSFGVTWEF